MKNIYRFFISIVICQLAGLVGSFFTAPSVSGWYQTLDKPTLTPPGYIIALVWVFLFLLMGISLYLAWAANWQVKITAKGWPRRIWNRWSQKFATGSWREKNAIIIFGLQLALNMLWSFVFFGLKSPGMAFFELLMLWVAILYTIVNFYRISKPAAYLLIPYILWVTFAGYLNFMIWQMNA
jgi:tryptophan-rich sensory protein